jgi:Subtilase family
MPGQYIVVFDPDAVTNVTEKVTALCSPKQVAYEYDNIAIKGVAIRNVTKQMLNQLEGDPEILFYAPVRCLSMIVSYCSCLMTYTSHFHRIRQDVTMSFASNEILFNATHNLDRLDDKLLPLNGKYKRKSDGGKGVTVYVLDSGIRSSHVEFEGRASCGFDAVIGIESNISCDDLVGHGTHVAGLIGGKTVGVAAQVTIVSVKVSTKNFTLNGGGVLKGVEFVMSEKQRNPSKPMIANLSFGTEKYPLFDIMIEGLLKLGVTVVSSAGNDYRNACQFSPSGVAGVITVGASDEVDVVPYWSNYGTCVDIYARGTNILSAWRREDTRYVVAEGTSQAAPMVAGAAALYLQMQPTLTSAQVSELLYLDSLKGILKPGPHYITNRTVLVLKNRLLHTGIFTDDNPQRRNPTCPYTGRKFYLCFREGWLKKN